MPAPAELLAAIDAHADEAERALSALMVGQGERARVAMLSSGGGAASAVALSVVPDAFADELFDAAEGIVSDMALLSANFAIDALPAGFGSITEVGLADIAGGVLDEVAEHMTQANEFMRERVRTAIIRGASDEHTVETIAEQIEMMVGDLITVDGRLVPAHARSKLIARTETAFASGTAEAEAWNETGVTEVQIFDSPDCGWNGHDDPEKPDGNIYSLARYRGQVLSHPNCVRTAAPAI